MTIVTVTPNPALDVTYLVAALRPGQMHRVHSVASRPGGKGINVARVLHRLGVPVLVTGLVGGPDGTALRAGLYELGIDDQLVDADIATRRTVTVVENGSGAATLLNEPGPVLDADQWDRLATRVTDLLRADAEVVTFSGSLPPGVPPTALADLASTVTGTGVPALVDTSGPALTAVAQAAAHRPTDGAAGRLVLKPNAEELAEVTGLSEPRRAAANLRATTGATVVVSLGPDGLLAATPEGIWSARLPEPLSGNPTGAGDSVVAALAMGIHNSLSWPETLRSACAVSAATVLAPVAGEYEPAEYRRLRHAVDIEEVTL
ncbi:1-phosphofructokinase family hexose kinase [Phytoactinopolyspora mesophila]|uniref:Hexose kinase n=1 Tax=Phytoactinopolyspora mesophila TaxID=2650750 RepID=A0A7K3M3Q0_9ACTN|nr:1-phosphofructokinase family hexose kinase [Phytoactinopolyspora mesophila]NDL57840.1 hexose kinase [Phytoactinopolyspora mesophila]